MKKGRQKIILLLSSTKVKIMLMGMTIKIIRDSDDNPMLIQTFPLLVVPYLLLKQLLLTKEQEVRTVEQQKKYNNCLTERMIKLAAEHGYYFKLGSFPGVRRVSADELLPAVRLTGTVDVLVARGRQAAAGRGPSRLHGLHGRGSVGVAH